MIKKEIIKEKIAKKKKKITLVLAATVIIVIVLIITHTRESIYVGTIEVTETDVAARVASQIAERIVDEGDDVTVDQPMYKLTCENYIVDHTKAKNDFERAQKLLASGDISPERYDAYRRTFEDSKLNIEWCTVRSPINGTILTKFHEPGDYVNIGTKLMAMGDLSDVWAYVYVDQPLLVELSIGEEVTGILPEIHNKPIPGRIIHIKDEAEFTPKNVQTRKERTRLVYGIKIKFDNSERLLKPGMPIEVRFKNKKGL